MINTTQTQGALDDGTPIIMKVKTTRVISVGPAAPRFEQLDDRDRLVSLHFDNAYSIKPGDTVQVGESLFLIQKIVKDPTDQSGYNLLIHKKVTTTSNFIVPFLGKSQWEFRFKRSFVNAFMGGLDNKYGTHIHLLYRPEGDDGFKTWNKEVKQHPMYVNQSTPDKAHILLKFRVPPSAKDAVTKIMNGKYSTLTAKDKSLILAWHGVSSSNILGEILFKSPKLRKEREDRLACVLPDNVELKSMFMKEDEIYTQKLVLKC